MNKYIWMILTVIIVMTFTACSSNPNTENVIKENSETETQQVKYELESVVQKQNGRIEYPQIRGFKGELLMDYMNQSLKRIADKYANKDIYSKVDISYEISRMDNDILSVVYKGTAEMKDIGNINIQDSVSLDVGKSTNEIIYENLFKNTESMQNTLKVMLDNLAKAKGYENGFEAEGVRIYFKNRDIVLYYMPLDDSAKKFVELALPIEDVRELLNEDFGDKPAS